MTVGTAETVSVSDPKPGQTIAFGERLTCSVAEASVAIGLSRSKNYELIGGGVVQSVTIGRRRLVSVPSLMRLTCTPSQRLAAPPVSGR